MVLKKFECEHCGATGRVVLKGEDYSYKDIVCCPVCGGDIFEEEDELDDE